jgi:hypothetical protein
MRQEELINNALTINDALLKIKSNIDFAYIWIPVKTKCGCYIELGGKSKNNKLELKADIPNYTKAGIPVKHTNGFVNSNYAIYYNGIENYSIIEFPIKNKPIKLFKDYKDFIKWCDERDFINNPVRLEFYTKEVLVEKIYSEVIL